MNDAQIKHMVERFLAWKLPENFNPDAGISFKPMFNENSAHPMRHTPSGTNLLDYTQAEAMVRHMVAALALPDHALGGEAATAMLDSYTSAKMDTDRTWSPAAVQRFKDERAAVIAALAASPATPTNQSGET